MDVSHWQIDHSVITIGTREKKALVDPKSGQRAFFKVPRQNTAEHWTEKIASELAHFIGFPCQKVEIAIYKGVQGALCYSFLGPEDELTHGSEILFGAYDNSKARNLSLHTVNFIKDHIGCQPYNIFKDFLTIPIFDALIGNTDRHSANWGVIYNVSSRKYRMAPLFDNSSSLGWQYINDEHIRRKLGNSTQWKSFIYDKSLSAIRWNENKITHLNLLEIINDKYPFIQDIIRSRIPLLTDEIIKELITKIDDGTMPPAFKKIVVQIIQIRRQALMKICEV